MRLKCHTAGMWGKIVAVAGRRTAPPRVCFAKQASSMVFFHFIAHKSIQFILRRVSVDVNLFGVFGFEVCSLKFHQTDEIILFASGTS